MLLGLLGRRVDACFAEFGIAERIRECPAVDGRRGFVVAVLQESDVLCVPKLVQFHLVIFELVQLLIALLFAVAHGFLAFRVAAGGLGLFDRPLRQGTFLDVIVGLSGPHRLEHSHVIVYVRAELYVGRAACEASPTNAVGCASTSFMFPSFKNWLQHQ